MIKKFNRRQVMSGAAAALGALSPSLANAQQTTIMDILRSPRRGNWADDFDSTSPAKSSVSNNLPILSVETIFYVDNAINQYRSIVAQGGWPVVPASESLKIGVRSPAVETLRRRLIISGDLPRNAGLSTSFDTFVDQAVKRFQLRHGLPADGVLGRYSFKALNVSAAVRLGQLETNAVRLRSMSGFLGERYVMVNIPAAQIEAVEGNKVVLRHTAIVGKTDRQTPILNSKIHEIILNPYWTSPKSIILKDIIPLMRKDPTYLTRNNIRLFDAQRNEVSPESVNWQTDEAVNLMFRQDPGKNNAMSSTKINFPNPHAVYMHDTPQQSLFGQLLRFESSGCVRVQNVRDLSTWLLRDTPGWQRQNIESTIKSRESTNILLTNPVPVYFTYVSAWSTNNGVVHFRDDIYGRDGVDELQISSSQI